jgi:F-type H+-transporting ATPase subunit b
MLTLHLEQIISQIIAFLIMYWILKRFAWKPLLRVLEERRQKIASEFEEIEVQKKEVAELKSSYHAKLKDIETEARRKIEEGVERGKTLAMKIQEEAHEEAKILLKNTKDEIQQEIAKGKRQLRKEVAEMAILLTKKILDESLDEQKQKKLVSEFVQKAELE